MKFTITSIICLAAATVATLAFSNQTFDRYQVILDRKPFGQIKIQPKQVDDPKNSFAKHLDIKSIIDDGRGLRVSFFDAQKNENFRLALNESHQGMTLIEANYDTEEAVLQKGLETCRFSLKVDDKTTSVSPPHMMPPLRSSTARTPTTTTSRVDPSNPLAARRSARQPLYRGETIENFLKNNPEAASQYPSPLRPPSPGQEGSWPPKAMGRGETIEKFLREHPEAVHQYPSPISPPNPGDAAVGRGETIEGFMQGQQNNSQMPPQFQIQNMPVSQDQQGMEMEYQQ